MRRIFRYLRDRRFKYDPLAEVTISRHNIIHNYSVLSKLSPKISIAPVLKSNAYGHGIIPTAKILDGEIGNSPLIVDSYYEALQLRNEGIRSPLLIIGYTLASNIYRSSLRDIAFTLHDVVQIRELSETLQSKRKFHLKIDTGMHRQGILETDFKNAVELIRKNPNIQIEGVCSHLGDAENLNQELTLKQIKAWNWIEGNAKLAFPKAKWFHLGASSAIPFISKINANMMRIGLALYGYGSKSLGLLPALELNSIITSIKTIEPGERVGYGATFETKSKTNLATVPVGYFEGVDLRLSGKGVVKIGSKFAGVAGRVSMNITSIDVTGVSEAKTGDAVTVISKDPKDGNSIENIAKTCQTISYEILVHIPVGIRRKIVE